MTKLLILSALTFITFLSSCNKCDSSNSTEGIIVEDAIVRIIGKAPEQALITNYLSSEFNIEVSFDGGLNYKSVDFSKYSVMALSTTASCSSGYNRSVTLDKTESIVYYTVLITECSTCQNSTTIPNYVLTTLIPEEYTAIYHTVRN